MNASLTPRTPDRRYGVALQRFDGPARFHGPDRPSGGAED
ncbi:hypothetical protein ATKI12_4171 [Kitasatospora sp. Ki12]